MNADNLPLTYADLPDFTQRDLAAAQALTPEQVRTAVAGVRKVVVNAEGQQITVFPADFTVAQLFVAAWAATGGTITPDGTIAFSHTTGPVKGPPSAVAGFLRASVYKRALMLDRMTIDLSAVAL